MVDVPPTGSPGGAPYRAEYTVNPQFKAFWQKLFPSSHLTDKQVHQMTDQFIKTVWNQMNSVLQWALKQQKERHRREKEDEG